MRAQRARLAALAVEPVHGAADRGGDAAVGQSEMLDPLAFVARKLEARAVAGNAHHAAVVAARDKAGLGVRDQRQRRAGVRLGGARGVRLLALEVDQADAPGAERERRGARAGVDRDRGDEGVEPPSGALGAAQQVVGSGRVDCHLRRRSS